MVLLNFCNKKPPGIYDKNFAKQIAYLHSLNVVEGLKGHKLANISTKIMNILAQTSKD